MATTLGNRVARLFSSAFRRPPADTFFQYEALKPGHFRIMTLLPDSARSPICCTLETVHQNSLPSRFVALSWAWGPAGSESTMITLNGRSHAIRQTLHESLEALRLPNEPRKLWVDAVCIDQNNDEEKSSQIALMPSIYTLADYVIVWLGKEANGSEFVMESLRHGRDEEFASTRFKKALQRILERPWFSRIWVIQEFALNKSSPQIACGSGPPVDWNCLYRAWHAVIESRYNMLHHPEQPFMLDNGDINYEFLRNAFTDGQIHQNDFFPGIFNVKLARDDFQTSGGSTLTEALWSLRGSQCSNARDYVYGILGLLDADTRATFLANHPVQYTKPVTQVYQDATEFLLTQGGIENTDPFTILRFHPRTEPPIPSWVLDFASSFQSRSPIGGTSEHAPVTARISNDRKTLMVHGLLLDSVSHTVPFAYDINDAAVSKSMQLLLIPVYGLSCLVNLWLRSPTPTFADAKRDAKVFSVVRDFVIGFYSVDCLMRERGRGSELAEPLWRTLLMENSEDDRSDDAEHQVSFNEMIELGSLDASVIPYLASGVLYTPLFQLLRASLRGRSFFMGTNGWYGVAEGDMEKHDQLALLFPPYFHPFIIRPVADKFEMVGVAYIPAALKKDILVHAKGELVEFDIV